MLIKPDLNDEEIIVCLRDAYEPIRIFHLVLFKSFFLIRLFIGQGNVSAYWG